MGSVEQSDEHRLAAPVENLRDAIPYLRRPFSPNAIKFKIGASVGTNRNLCLPYIDARLVVERLNVVVGEMWSDRYEMPGERLDTGVCWCHLTVDGVTRSDIGRGQGDDVLKAAVSDALKRAGVHFGVGVSLYAMGRFELNVTEDGHLVSDQPTLAKNKRGKAVMTPDALRLLRTGYKEWAEDAGKDKFGLFLDHGDSEDSLGDPVEAAAETEAPPESESDLELAAGRDDLQKLYDEAVKGDTKKRRAYPAARFKAQLEAAASAEDLAELREKIEGL